MHSRLLHLLLLCLLAVSCGRKAAPGIALLSREEIAAALQSAQKDPARLHAMLGEYRRGGDSLAAALTLRELGGIYRQDRNYIDAIHSFMYAIPPLAESGTVEERVNNLLDLATACRRIGAYSNAAEVLFDAMGILAVAPDKNSPKLILLRSHILNSLGLIYQYLGKSQEAESYLRESLLLDRNLRDEEGMAMNWSSIGLLYEQRGAADSAEIMYSRALEHNIKAGANEGIGICFNRLGHLFTQNGQTAKAKEAYLNAYTIFHPGAPSPNRITTCLALSQLYLAGGEFEDARRYLQDAETDLKGIRQPNMERRVRQMRADLYARQGDWRSALEESRACLALLDSIEALGADQIAASNRIRFEQEKNRERVNKALQDFEAEKRANRQIRLIMIPLLAALGLLVFLLLRLVNLRRRRGRELAERNSVNSKFLSLLSHDLKNPVIAQNRLFQTIADNYDALPAEMVREQIGSLSDSSESMLDMLQGILNWSQLTTGKITCSPARFELRPEIIDTLHPLEEQMKLKEITPSIEVPGELFVEADRLITSTVIRNLVSNAIKFSHKGSTVHIRSQVRKNGHVCIEIRDEGIGMPEHVKEKLFSLSNDHPASGTAGEKGSGLGLIICKEMLEIAGSHLEWESEEGKGSVFRFEIKGC